MVLKVSSNFGQWVSVGQCGRHQFGSNGTCIWFCDLVWVDFEDFSDMFDQWDDDGQTTFLFNIFLYVSFTMKKQSTTA